MGDKIRRIGFNVNLYFVGEDRPSFNDDEDNATNNTVEELEKKFDQRIRASLKTKSKYMLDGYEVIPRVEFEVADEEELSEIEIAKEDVNRNIYRPKKAYVPAPYRNSRWTPSPVELYALCDFLNSLDLKKDNFLEIGGGYSTWYLTQLGFKNYVAVETFKKAVNNVRKYHPDVLLLGRWTDIPVRAYQCVFIDSHVGGEEKDKEQHRYFPLEYVMENNLYDKDTILVNHDHRRYKNPKHRKSEIREWNKTLQKYGWKLIHEVLLGRQFGVYKRDQ